MGILTRLFKGETLAPLVSEPVTFSLDIDSGVLYGTPTIDDYIAGRVAVTRDRALSVPAVKRARDLIAGGIGQFPLQLINDKGQTEAWPLFKQFEPDVAPSVTITRIVEDILFHGVAWLHVVELGYHLRPRRVRRLDPATVSVQQEWITYADGTAKRYVPTHDVIRIDGPSIGLLEAGRTAINVYLALAKTTHNAAEALPPMSYFAPVDDVDPMDDDEVQEVLDAWREARKRNVTGYVPAALKLNTLGWSPEQLELTELRNQAVLEIARLAGVDPEELGVSTTSRTYANAADRHRQFLDFTLGPIMTAIEGRLSMDDVTPAGYRVDFDDANFLRADDLTRAQTDSALIAAGILTVNEAREHRGLPPIKETPADERPALEVVRNEVG